MNDVDISDTGRQRSLKIIEWLLIAGGVSLLAVWAGVTVWGSLASQAEVAQLQRTLAVPDQALWSRARKQAYLDSLEREPGAAIAVLTIDRLDIETPVFDSVNELNLNRGVSRIEGTATLAEADNLGIAGHRDSFFRPLKDVEIGERIRLTSALGVTEYQVMETLIVDPEDVWVLDPADQATLTLVTCYPFYFVGSAPERFIVRAVAVSDT